MRYHYTKPEKKSLYSLYGKIYKCNHIVYSECTLFKIDDKGLAVIQQRYDPMTKATTWTSIDPWLSDEIYLNPGFKEYFEKYGGAPTGELYPTVSVRQIMWALKMKPLKRERWETSFDHRHI